jgi:hypothetical protein
MKIANKIKLGLDETRMLVLGAQVLVGFQFRGVFADGFERLPELSRYLDAVALLLMMVTLGLLILPGLYQRLVEHGFDSGRLFRFTGRVAGLALAPFSVSLGLDIGIATERLWGTAGGIAAGAATGLLAVVFWYGLEAVEMRSKGKKERKRRAAGSWPGPADRPDADRGACDPARRAGAARLPARDRAQRIVREAA